MLSLNTQELKKTFKGDIRQIKQWIDQEKKKTKILSSYNPPPKVV